MLYPTDRIRFASDGANGGGQEPPQTDPQPTGQDSGGRDYEAEIKALREEAAKWRTNYRTAESQVKELSPAAAKLAEIEEANKTEAQKTAERLAALEAQLAQSKAAAELAVKRNRLTVLATKAGVSADVVEYLDAGKFDLNDEETTLKALKALASSAGSTGGSPSNPGRTGNNGQLTPEEWYKQQQGKKTSIFGG